MRKIRKKLDADQRTSIPVERESGYTLAMPDSSHRPKPTPWSLVLFSLKSRLLQVFRFLREVVSRPPRHRAGALVGGLGVLLAEVRSPLWTEANPHEKALQRGKVANLRRAALCLRALSVPAGEVFSFWTQVGAPLRIRGFAQGRELREGCLIPTVGGGLCQLSNALYQAALESGLEIVERHAHSQIVPGSNAENDLDATVFWNYVDLRFRAPFSWQLDVDLTDRDLVVRLWGPDGLEKPKPVRGPLRRPLSVAIGSCASCGQTECRLHIDQTTSPDVAETTAWLVDDYWPEFDAWAQAHRVQNDILLAPLDGNKWKKPNYGWTHEGFRRVKTHPLFALQRSLVSRRLSSQGAARQRAMLGFEAKLARLYARRLGPEVTKLVVTQTLLPFLELQGALAGRRVEVLLTRAPMKSLQATLDLAARFHPESQTLGDFRADPGLVAAEERALARAQKVITPHRALAEGFPGRAEVLSWSTPTRSLPKFQRQGGPVKIGFLGPTLGRKGAWEARAALGRLTPGTIELIVLGPQLEGPDFWGRLNVSFRTAIGPHTLADLDIVLSPSWVEHGPRRLIDLLEAGHHVVATTACGLAPHPRLTTVAPGDAQALTEVLEDLCSRLGS